MAGHDKESPSSLQQKKLCAGSANAQRGIPNGWSTSSIHGTAQHQVVEGCFNGAAHLLEHDSLNVCVDTPGHDQDVTTVKLDRDDLDAVSVAYDYILSKWDDNSEVYIETKVDPAPYIGYTKSKGTADTLILSQLKGRSVLEVVDYKGGKGHLVEIDGCIQVITYGIGGIAMADEMGVHVDDVILTIVQPHIPHKDGVIRSIKMSREELLSWVPEIKEIIKGSRDPKAKRTAGEYQCRHCTAKRDCVAVTEKALAVAQTVFKPLGKVTNKEMGANLTRNPSCLTAKQRGLILENSSLIKGWLKAVEEHAWREDLKGRKTPGFKVVEGQTKRKYVKPDEDVIAALRDLRKTDKQRVALVDIAVTKLHTPKQLETSLKKRMTDKSWAKVQKLITKPTGSMTMVPDSDPRDRYIKSATEVFKPIATNKDLTFLK